MLHRSSTAFAAAGTAVLALAVTSLASEPRRDTSPSENPRAGRISASVVPGTRAVLAKDLGRNRNPCLIWGRISDPYLSGCDSSGANDPYIVRRTRGGDPHRAVRAASPSRYYRRYISRAGVQSISDAETGNDSTRTQTQKWGTRKNSMSFARGTYAFYLSFRLQELANGSSPFPHRQARGGGIAKFSQLVQWKSFGGGLPNWVALYATIGRDGIKFVPHSGDGRDPEPRILRLPHGKWIRMAVVVNWDSNGWYAVWADRDGNGSMRKVLARQKGIDFAAGRTHGAMGIGPYHKLSLFDGTVAGQPRQAKIHTDYANVQITRWARP